ncbi:hypothetical protein BAE44_0004246 [Dichanthelium oligosanthes]|uniref:SMP domain-containing protein n=1 Tax=Dichanthelium oligosanthes TaxID=888268 RepID=A0A1E5WBD3_9POAL|nr:hypothetical protein BAE44_0004246 [Dichanthelium oligosanthes]
MSLGQPRRPQGEALQAPDQPIKYGDVFDVTGELANHPVAPRDAALLQSAEQAVLGLAQKGGPPPSCSRRPRSTRPRATSGRGRSRSPPPTRAPPSPRTSSRQPATSSPSPSAHRWWCGS